MDEGRFLKNLDAAFVFRNAKTEEEQSQLLYHMYVILKPNEGCINERTKRLLQMIEELVPEKSESNLHGEELSEKVCMTKFGFTSGTLYRLDECDENPTSMDDIIKQTFPTSSRLDRISPDSGVSSDINEENGQPNKHVSNLPTSFHLMSRLKVATTIKSSDLIQLCNSSVHSKQLGNSIFEDVIPKPILPTPPKVDNLCLKPKVSLIYVKNQSDALSDVLRRKCMNAPICVIRCLAHTVGLDLSKFTTKNIERIAQDYEMDLREQWSTSDTDWFYPSYRYRTKLDKYSQYQGDSFAIAIKDGYSVLKKRQNPDINSNTITIDESPQSKKRKHSSQPIKKNRIYFGTNLDFSEAIFAEQVTELQKLPPFCRLADETNFLSHLGYDLKGMNTAQFYIKIPGCRTPAHLENNSFCSVNLNIGPGDCEWFGVSYEYYPQIDQMCKEKKLDFLGSSWWPNYDELIAARIPVYRFMQKTGDIVFINGGCVHWVEAKGWCNNIAWNVGPMCSDQYKLNLMSTEFNKIRRFESLIPMQFLSWNVAKNCQIMDPELHDLLRSVLIRSLAHNQLTLEYVRTELPHVKVYPIEQQLELATTNCSKCKTEIFNIIFANPTEKSKKEKTTEYETFCLCCAKQVGFKCMEVWQVYKMNYLCDLLDKF